MTISKPNIKEAVKMCLCMFGEVQETVEKLPIIAQ